MLWLLFSQWKVTSSINHPSAEKEVDKFGMKNDSLIQIGDCLISKAFWSGDFFSTQELVVGAKHD